MEEALHQPVSVNEKGVQRKLPALQVILRQVRNAAMRGHLPAAKFLLAPMLQNEKPTDRETDYSKLSDEELQQRSAAPGSLFRVARRTTNSGYCGLQSIEQGFEVTAQFNAKAWLRSHITSGRIDGARRRELPSRAAAW